MAEEGSEEVKKSSGDSKGIMIVLIALIVILMLAVGGIGYFLYSKGVLSDQPALEQSRKIVKNDALKETFKTSINDLVLNITNSKGREKLMKLSFTLKSVEPTIEAIVEEFRPEIIDAVIAQISSRSSEELLTVGGKALLKEELLEDINIILNEARLKNEDIIENSVKKMFFTAFVIK